MILPPLEDLDEVSALIDPALAWADLGPEARIQVLNLAIMADISHSLDTLHQWFKVSRVYDGK